MFFKKLSSNKQSYNFNYTYSAAVDTHDWKKVPLTDHIDHNSMVYTSKLKCKSCGMNATKLITLGESSSDSITTDHNTIPCDKYQFVLQISATHMWTKKNGQTCCSICGTIGTSTSPPLIVDINNPNLQECEDGILERFIG